MTIKVGLVGATGYTALEVARLLRTHPNAELVAATSRQNSETLLSEVHPSLVGTPGVPIAVLDAKKLASRCDVVMCCLPHGASAETVKQLAAAGVRVIDFSADFRLSCLETYESWYGVRHPWPERFGDVVYGMPEFFRDSIRNADIVANPGCYPTSAIMPLAPLCQAGLVDPSDIIVDSKSGVSGAGRSPKVGTLYCEVNESIAAYSVGTHRHGPEIVDILGRVADVSTELVFTPHLAPMQRGILSTIYCRPAAEASLEQIRECLNDFYADEPFVHVVDRPPATGHVMMSNGVHINATTSGDRAILTCAIDNLTKGASGAAVQNMNVMFGQEETAGLLG